MGSLSQQRAQRWVATVIWGAAAGVAGAGAMAVLQLPLRRYLRCTSRRGSLADSGIGFQAVFRMPDPTTLTAYRALLRKPEDVKQSLTDALIVHAGFGAGAGAFYACFVRRLLRQRMAGSLAFGAVLWASATELALPLLSLSKPPSESSTAIQLFGLGEHLLYSLILEEILVHKVA